jgi:IS30 family transposase
MGTFYTQLTLQSRQTIQELLALGFSLRSIAAALDVSPSTISREIKRGSLMQGAQYLAADGQHARAKRRRSAGLFRRKLGADTRSPAWRAVIAGLRKSWSPEQVIGDFKRRNALSDAGSDPLPSLSHETIYCAIYARPRGALRTQLVKLLRRSHAGRLPRARGKSRSPRLQGMVSIDLRPPEVAARIVPGHWEGDLIKGAGNRSAVGVLVERVSRYVMLVRMASLGSAAFLDSFKRRLQRIPASLRKTLTYDQGSEMAMHASLSEQLSIDIFFCDPHSPWQRGTNENTNGLVREYLPKGHDLSTVTDAQLRSIEYALNTRPRKVLDFATPEEVFAGIKLSEVAGVALQS